MSENDSLQELAEEQAALRRVATLVAVEHDPERVFAAVTEEAGRRVGAQTSNLARFGDGDTALIVGEWSEGGVSAMPNGATVPLDGPTVSALVRRTGRPARVDDFTELSGTLAARIRELGLYSGVGAPVHVGGELWGALIVSSVRPNGFPSDAEHRVAEFAELAGVAVAEADGREHLQRMADEQAALRRVATLVAVEHDAPTLFSKVTEEAARVMGALQGNLTRYEGEDGAFVLGHWVAEGGVAGVDAGEHVTLDGQTVSGLVRDTGRPSRVDDYSETTGPLARRIHDLGIRSAVGAPIRVGGELWGVLTVQSEQPHFFAERAEERVQAFTDLVAAAVSETEARQELAASRARIVEASYEARRQIERDLHDGAQQRLVALALDLRGVESQLERSPEGAAPHLAQARGQLEEALAELRELARGIHPGVLTDRGLVPALDSLASRSPVPVETEADLEGRLSPAVEAAAYFVVSEALANVAKYASATAVSVQVAREDGLARVTVRDDGVGGADPTAGSGLRGLRDRVEALGGRLEVESPAGEGTTVCVELPVA
jgi:signal transduction histidine kinase